MSRASSSRRWPATSIYRGQQHQQMSSAPVLSFLHLPVPPPFLCSHSGLCLPSKQEHPWTFFLKQQPRHSPPAVARIRAASSPAPARRSRASLCPAAHRVAPLLRSRHEHQVVLTSLDRCGRSHALTARGPPLASQGPAPTSASPSIGLPLHSSGPQPEVSSPRPCCLLGRPLFWPIHVFFQIYEFPYYSSKTVLQKTPS